MNKNPTTQNSIKEITNKLEDGLKNLFDSEKYKQYLMIMSKFHNYSYSNVLLIGLQNPKATFVAGYNKWKKDFKRQVKYGEKGIKIIAPIPYKVKIISKKESLESMGELLPDDITEVTSLRFKVVSVFDVSQTEGEPLPSIATELTGDVDNYPYFFNSLMEISPLPITFEKMATTAKGFCRYGEKIVIKEGMSEIQTIKTALHEIAHSVLHDHITNSEVDKSKKRNVKEIEAESVAYVICQYFGIDTSDYSFGYLASWSNKDTKELSISMELIQKTSSKLIDSINEKYRGITNKAIETDHYNKVPKKENYELER